MWERSAKVKKLFHLLQIMSSAHWKGRPKSSFSPAFSVFFIKWIMALGGLMDWGEIWRRKDKLHSTTSVNHVRVCWFLFTFINGEFYSCIFEMNEMPRCAIRGMIWDLAVVLKLFEGLRTQSYVGHGGSRLFWRTGHL